VAKKDKLQIVHLSVTTIASSPVKIVSFCLDFYPSKKSFIHFYEL